MNSSCCCCTYTIPIRVLVRLYVFDGFHVTKFVTHLLLYWRCQLVLTNTSIHPPTATGRNKRCTAQHTKQTNTRMQALLPNFLGLMNVRIFWGFIFCFVFVWPRIAKQRASATLTTVVNWLHFLCAVQHRLQFKLFWKLRLRLFIFAVKRLENRRRGTRIIVSLRSHHVLCKRPVMFFSFNYLLPLPPPQLSFITDLT